MPIRLPFTHFIYLLLIFNLFFLCPYLRDILPFTFNEQFAKSIFFFALFYQKVKEEMSPPESDHMKKLFARQRAKDLADHAKAMLAKDREIEELRKKCQELADTLSNADFLGPEVRRGNL